MTDILGAISASLDLAIFITKQVEKVLDAPETVQVITDDVRRLSRILAQLSDTLRPAPDPRGSGHSYTAVRLSSQGLRNGLESVQRCHTTLKKLDRAMEGIFGKDPWNRDDEPLRFGKRARLNYASHDGRVRRLLGELRECKWDIMLSNSVNQLYLAKQPSQLHPLDQEKLDYLQVLCELALVHKQDKHNATVFPPNPAATVAGKPDIFSPDAVHVPGGDKGLKPTALPQRPAAASQPMQPQSSTAGSVIRQVHRSTLDKDVLDQQKIRWLNDPFDSQYINIHDHIDDTHLKDLMERSERIRIEETSKLKTEKGGLRRSAATVVDRERKSDVDLKEFKSNPIDNNTPASSGRENMNNMVDDLMRQWILPSPEKEKPKPKPATPPKRDDINTSPTTTTTTTNNKCHKRFRKGERMYACPKCGYDDRKVFCTDCFTTDDHQGHGVETIVAKEDGEAYCDCGHARAVKRRMTCAKHGTMIPER
ncbi:ubiquitin-protein ligase e3 component [Apiospora saccharicola]|uniref:E3 ubiquitin-protein ligase n=1 Tax=Apiospora saccharicola TaxID=335842 RepID=A0ABR1UJ76_9PEZI